MIDNDTILKKRIELRDKKEGIRIGDYLVVEDGDYRRVAHIWDDGIQPSSGNPSIYLGDGYMSYSGGLDSAIPLHKIEDTGEIKNGDCWFFDKNIAGAGRRVMKKLPCRVFKVKP